jgi:hypothetical protein
MSETSPSAPVRTAGPVVCFDADCGMCRATVAVLARLGLVEEERLQPFQSFEDEVATRLLEANVHNELAVLDPESLEIRSGVDGLLWAFEGSWLRPLLGLARLAPVHALLHLLYRLIAYNRRVLSPVRAAGIRCACDPDFHLGLRLGFTGISVAGTLLVAWAAGLMGSALVLLGLFGGAALLRGGTARYDGLAHAAWVSLLVMATAGLSSWIPGLPVLALPSALLLVLAWHRRQALDLPGAAVLGLAGLGGLGAALVAHLL